RSDALDLQIEAVQATLAGLVDGRTKMTEFVHKHTALLSPIRRIPPKLLDDIFSLVSPSKRRIGGATIQQPPWHLGHICSSWRRTALAYPHLW
ncbi:hypothetical protein C8R43DRAFT_851623, partial [Mycena crocata]